MPTHDHDHDHDHDNYGARGRSRARRAHNSGAHGHTGNPPDRSLGRFDIIARWLADHLDASDHISPAGIMASVTSYWELYQTHTYADLWYGARAAGERLRGVALERLYRSRKHPGGPHPDPREPAAFSSQAVLSIAANLLGLRVSPTLISPQSSSQSFSPSPSPSPSDSDSHASYGDLDLDEETGHTLPYAWIKIFPITARGQRQPEIALRTLNANPHLLEHEIACLLGYWHRDYRRLTDPDAPHGIVMLPHDPSIETLLHQYAIGLLCLPRDCPPSWHCHCNAIRARFNAPPPDHEQPTDALTVEELEDETRRQRTDTEPRFPYPNPNAWTEE